MVKPQDYGTIKKNKTRRFRRKNKERREDSRRVKCRRVKEAFELSIVLHFKLSILVY